MTRLPSLLRRMVAWQVAAMLVAWLVLSAWLVVQMMRFCDGDLDRRMQTFARTLAETASACPSDAELPARLAATERIFVDGVIGGLDSEPGYVPRYDVRSPDERLRYASPGAAGLALPRGAPGFAESAQAGHRYRSVRVESSDGSTRVAMSERADLRFSAPLLRIIGAGQLLILAWCLAATCLAAHRGLRPLERLAQRLSRRPAGDLSPLVVERLYVETAPVVREINALLARESARLQTERGFLADAAHELRTPLAAIVAQAERCAGADDPMARAAASSELHLGVRRVSHLLTQLLAIARLDASADGAPREFFDAAETCRQCLAAMSRAARAKRVDLTLEAPDALPVRARLAAFVSILDNLVDNAIRYTAEGGHVEVRLGPQGDDIVLEVRDDGPGIAAADRERVFDRFVRLAGHDEPGSGLGLAIVRRAASGEGAVIRFVDGLGGRGVGLSVRMPRTGAAPAVPPAAGAESAPRLRPERPLGEAVASAR